jgi:hypothetical protein
MLFAGHTCAAVKMDVNAVGVSSIVRPFFQP